MEEFEPRSMTDEMIETLANFQLSQQGDCEYCGANPIMTMCFKCHKRTCREHVVNPNEDRGLTCKECWSNFAPSSH